MNSLISDTVTFPTQVLGIEAYQSEAYFDISKELLLQSTLPIPKQKEKKYSDKS